MSPFSKHFDALELGEVFTTASREVGEADIMEFAALTGDRHPQHTDPDWARSSHFGEQIAHGLLVLSYAAGLVPLDPERVMALRRIGDAVFKAPVKIGDSIRVEGRVATKRELDDRHGLVECRWKVLNQHDKLVMRAAVELVWRRDAPGGAPDGADRAEPNPVVVRG